MNGGAAAVRPPGQEVSWPGQRRRGGLGLTVNAFVAPVDHTDGGEECRNNKGLKRKIQPPDPWSLAESSTDALVNPPTRPELQFVIMTGWEIMYDV